MGPTSILSRVRGSVPVQPFARALLVRSTLLWILIRATATFFDYLLTEAVTPLPFIASIGVIGLTVLLGVVDVRRRGEQLFLANLGAGWAGIIALVAGPPVLLEIVVAAVGPT